MAPSELVDDRTSTPTAPNSLYLPGLDGLRALAQNPMNSAAASRFTHDSMRFHEALVEASHNRALVAQFRALAVVLEPVYGRRTTDDVAKRVIASHKAVLDAVAGRDAERACALMRRRLQVIRAKQLIKPM